MKTKTYLLLMLFSLIGITGYGQVPGGNANKVEITYSVINATNRTIGVGVGKPDSAAVDPFYVGDITIPDAVFPNNVEYKVVGITDYAFKDCNGIKKVVIGKNVSVIGKEAFNSCMGITEVQMPYNLMSVGDGAFEGTRGVKSLSMNGQSVAVVGKSAFVGSTDLQQVRLQPKMMASVGERAFAGCTRLKKVLIYGHIAVIGKGAFAGCTNLTEIVICADSVMSIGNDAFQGCENLQTITIRGSQPIIGTGVFAGCGNVKEVRCYTDVPPTSADGLFSGTDVSNAVLKINPVTLDLFKAAPSWKGFQMVEVDENALGLEEDYMFVADGVEEAPEFPGGQYEMLTYLAKKVKFPASAQEKGINGTVLVEFVVDKDGRVIEPNIVESLGTDCDYEALRAVSTMPAWKPAKHNGKPVRVRNTVPIQFMSGFPNTMANRPTNVNVRATNANTRTTNTNPVARLRGNGQVEILRDGKFETLEPRKGYQPPEFVGGPEKLLAYIARNTNYPSEAYKKGIQGRVIVEFTIATDGSVTNPKVKESVDPVLDKEALRVVSEMPRWNPGKENGKVVSMKTSVPIQFMSGIPNANNTLNKTSDVNKTSNANAAAANVKIAHAGADEDEVYEVVEVMPEFPGGQDKLLEYLGVNVRYPEEAREKGIQGTVVVSFVIDKEGNVTEPKIVRSLEDEIDQEAIRVVNAMPKWTPGKEKGKPVRVKYTVPIRFLLN